MQAKVEAMHLQAKEQRRLPAHPQNLGRDKDRVVPQGPQQEPANILSRTSFLLNWETKHFCCFSGPALANKYTPIVLTSTFLFSSLTSLQQA